MIFLYFFFVEFKVKLLQFISRICFRDFILIFCYNLVFIWNFYCNFNILQQIGVWDLEVFRRGYYIDFLDGKGNCYLASSKRSYRLYFEYQ